MHPAPQTIVIAGPTGSGKTALAIAVAERIGGEILSADSMQFYRGMEIGTAAPTLAEQARVPHHFVSCLDPGEPMAAGEFQRQGRELIARLHAAGKPAIVVGGSGLYIRALIEGLFEGPERDAAVRARLEHEADTAGLPALVARLREVDPAYAETLTSENDRIRVVRALEVYESTGTPFSQWHAAAPADPIPAQSFGLDWERAALYARINRRVEQMVADGWVDEVRRLLDAGHGPHIERLKALGFRELAAHLRGEQSLEAAIARTQMHHRRYAKRQLIWFRANPHIEWLPTVGETGPLAEAIVSKVVQFPRV